MFYDTFINLCIEHNVSPSKAVTEMGIDRSAVTRWKNGQSGVTETNLQKMSAYFGVPVSYFQNEKGRVEIKNKYSITGENFYNKVAHLCDGKRISVNKLMGELNISTSNPTFWKKGKVPRDSTVQQISDYFGVSMEYFSVDNDIDNIIYNVSDTKNEVTSKEMTPREKKIADITARFQAMPEEKLDTIMEFLGISPDD